MNVNVDGCGGINNTNAHGKDIVAARVNTNDCGHHSDGAPRISLFLRPWQGYLDSKAGLHCCMASRQLLKLRFQQSPSLSFTITLKGLGKHLDTTVVTTD